jgi:hypothetical protein
MQTRKRTNKKEVITEETATHDSKIAMQKGDSHSNFKIRRVLYGGENGGPISLSDKFDSRKVVVRIGKDGEPCPFGGCDSPRFEAYFFIRWLTFDSDQPRQYAECSREPIFEDPSTCSAGGLCEGTRRRFNHLASHSTTCTVPCSSVFFIHADLAEMFHLDPDPNQESYFPELVEKYEGPIDQPYSRAKAAINENEAIIKSNRITPEELRVIPTVGNGLDVRMSRIPQSGRGVYALRDFSQGEIVTLYFGHPFGDKQRKLLQQEGRGTHAKPVDFKHKYLDGVKTVFKGMHVGQLLNQGTADACNCGWATLENKSNSAEKILAIRALRKIHAGEELYISYGKKYWEEILISPRKSPPIQLPRSS